ncbi:hypothetical protein V8E53_009926 [Lactarius tabidus]
MQVPMCERQVHVHEGQRRTLIKKWLRHRSDGQFLGAVKEMFFGPMQQSNSHTTREEDYMVHLKASAIYGCVPVRNCVEIEIASPRRILRPRHHRHQDYLHWHPTTETTVAGATSTPPTTERSSQQGTESACSCDPFTPSPSPSLSFSALVDRALDPIIRKGHEPHTLSGFPMNTCQRTILQLLLLRHASEFRYRAGEGGAEGWRGDFVVVVVARFFAGARAAFWGTKSEKLHDIRYKTGTQVPAPENSENRTTACGTARPHTAHRGRGLVRCQWWQNASDPEIDDIVSAIFAFIVTGTVIILFDPMLGLTFIWKQFTSPLPLPLPLNSPSNVDAPRRVDNAVHSIARPLPLPLPNPDGVKKSSSPAFAANNRLTTSSSSPTSIHSPRPSHARLPSDDPPASSRDHTSICADDCTTETVSSALIDPSAAAAHTDTQRSNVGVQASFWAHISVVQSRPGVGIGIVVLGYGYGKAEHDPAWVVVRARIREAHRYIEVEVEIQVRVLQSRVVIRFSGSRWPRRGLGDVYKWLSARGGMTVSVWAGAARNLSGRPASELTSGEDGGGEEDREHAHAETEAVNGGGVDAGLWLRLGLWYTAWHIDSNLHFVISVVWLALVWGFAALASTLALSLKDLARGSLRSRRVLALPTGGT